MIRGCSGGLLRLDIGADSPPDDEVIAVRCWTRILPQRSTVIPASTLRGETRTHERERPTAGFLGRKTYTPQPVAELLIPCDVVDGMARARPQEVAWVILHKHYKYA